MNRTTVSLTLLSLAICAVTTLWAEGPLTPPAGAPSPGMKRLDQIHAGAQLSNGPLLISQPGHYYLTQNVSVGPGAPAISITTSNVSLDLNGFTVETTAANAGQAGISIESTVPIHNVSVTNGIVSGATHGVRLRNARGCSISGLSLTATLSYGIYLSSLSSHRTQGNRIENCALFDCASGILVYAQAGGICSGNTLKSCVIDGAVTNSGIALIGDGTSGVCSGNLVEDCLIGSTSAVGLLFQALSQGQCVGNKAIRCSVTDCGTGIRLQAIDGTVEGCELLKCTVADTTSNGIVLTAGTGRVRSNRIEDCVITGAGGFGVFMKGTDGICAGNALLRSIVHDTPSNNIYLQDSDSNRIKQVHSTSGSRGIVWETTSFNIVTEMTVAECPQPYLQSAGTDDTRGPITNHVGVINTGDTAASPWANLYR